MSATTAPPQVRLPGPKLWISLAILFGGLVLFVAGIVGAINKVIDPLYKSTIRPLPVNQSLRLRPGTYDVYQLTGTSPESDGLNFSTGNASGTTTLRPSDVSVTGPNGPIPIFYPSADSTDTLTRDGDNFTPAVQFEVTTTADYKVSIKSRGGGDLAIVALSIGSAVSKGVVWFILFGIGGLAGIAGFVLMLVGILRRRSAKRRGDYFGGYGGYGGYGGAPNAGYAGHPPYGSPPPYAGAPPGYGSGPTYGGIPAYGQQLGTSPDPSPDPSPEPSPEPAEPEPTPEPAPERVVDGPAAGWYDDPAHIAAKRYWDGQRWTDQTQT